MSAALRARICWRTTDARFSDGATTHGGILAAVADVALSTAVLTQLGAGADVVTTNLSVTYLRPVALSGRYRCGEGLPRTACLPFGTPSRRRSRAGTRPPERRPPATTSRR